MDSVKLLVLTTCAGRDEAIRLANLLVESRLAACVNIIDRVSSVYRWKDTIEQGTEALLIIKTTSGRYAELEAEVREHSSYELPEIVAVGVERGLPEYLSWVAGATAR